MRVEHGPFLLCVAEIVCQSAAHSPGVECRSGRHLSALFPECRPSGGVHKGGLHGGGHRWVQLGVNHAPPNTSLKCQSGVIIPVWCTGTVSLNMPV